MKESGQTKNKVREARKMSKKKYGFLFIRVAEILYGHDPVYLAECGAPTDEYEVETSMILPQLKNVESVAETRKIIYDVFDKMFNHGYSASDLSKETKVSDAAGIETDYQLIAEEVWAAWREFKSASIEDSE